MPQDSAKVLFWLFGAVTVITIIPIAHNTPTA